MSALFGSIDPHLNRWIEQNEPGVFLIQDCKDFEVRSIWFINFSEYTINISIPDHRGRCAVYVSRHIKNNSRSRKHTILVEDPNDIGFYLDEAYGMIVRGF